MASRMRPAPQLIPCLLLGPNGRVCLPGESGPYEVRDREGRPLDLFDVADRIAESHRRLYLVDLEGIEQNRPQLDYFQELARDLELWVDAGVQTADQAIDILVSGASKAVLSSAHIASIREVERAWKLSPELAFELEFEDGMLAPPERGWGGTPDAVSEPVRAIGVPDLIVSPHGDPIDWALVARLARGGRTWIDGSFESRDIERLAPSGAAGAFFHLTDLLRALGETEG